MIDILEYKRILIKYGFLHEVYIKVLDLIDTTIDIEPKEKYEELYLIYFSLISDGNICMSLDKDILKDKWGNKIDDTSIMNLNKKDFEKKELDLLKEESFDVIDNYLECLKSSQSLNNPNGFFMIDEDYLYMKKYYYSRLGIIESIKRLFPKTNKPCTIEFDYKDIVKENFELSAGQEKALKSGISKNLVITGGPGTGKTTSILFLLIALLKKDIGRNIYLTAPSGKAAQRMKESILGGLNVLKDSFIIDNPTIINKIKELNGQTIHTLLNMDYSGKFRFNKNNMFEENSIFVIDEASMIDITIFNALLESIPTGALVYIMGDKNQLPSVEVGAVFECLLECVKDRALIELDESKRFEKASEIYNLAYNINNGLELKNINFLDLDSFYVRDNDKVLNGKKVYPIYYYSDKKDNIFSESSFNKAIIEWNKKFYKSLLDKSKDVETNDVLALKEVFDISEEAKILCAENEGIRGVNGINILIRKYNNDNKSIHTYRPGEILMINTNNKSLDLYNGDSGVIVTFKNDKTLYLMLKKTSNIISQDMYVKDRIFKLNEFVFYPLRFLQQDAISLAYAITIHKSQGSDYKNILVILPENKNHPLVNRQIVYTAITRTKGSTYIISNIDTLNKAKDNKLTRDTNIEIED